MFRETPLALPPLISKEMMKSTRYFLFAVALLGTLLSFTFNYVAITGIGDPLNNESDTLAIEIIEEIDPMLYDTSCVFERNWYNDRTFAYMGDKEVTFTDSTIIPICNVFHDACYPVKNKINSPFGHRGSRFHKGLDIALKRGDTVLSAFDGKVRYAKFNNGGFGNLVIIRHNNGLETYYAHLNKLKVKPNDTVTAGQLIGLGGNTGASSGAHLHFEVRIEDKPIDPAVIFDTETFTLKADHLELADVIFAPSRRSHKKVAYDKNATIYKVRSGDCLSTIAKRHGISVNNLYRLNGLSTRSVLQIGQKVRVR